MIKGERKSALYLFINRIGTPPFPARARSGCVNTALLVEVRIGSRQGSNRLDNDDDVCRPAVVVV